MDLIAFGAAVGLKLPNLARGQLILSHRDAVEAIAHKYLQPIKNEHEKSNLLRLAALAVYEILLPKGQLPKILCGDLAQLPAKTTQVTAQH